VRAAGSLTDAAIFLTAALCGLRRSEVLGLRWRAVLFAHRALVLRRGYTDAGGRFSAWAPASSAAGCPSRSSSRTASSDRT
jgi:integrase